MHYQLPYVLQAFLYLLILLFQVFMTFGFCGGQLM